MAPMAFDAIVVGSGISGGWAAKELTEHGLKTIVLEAGRPIDPAVDYSKSEMERALIEKTLERTGGNKSKAARLLNVHRRSIYNRLKKYGVDPSH